MKKYPNILNLVTSAPWMIQEDKLDAICDVIEFRILNGIELSQEEIETRLGARAKGEQKYAGAYTSGPVGVLPVQGTMMPKATLFSQISGGSSITEMRSDFQTMLDDPAIQRIILDMDTPGGIATFVPEFADEIYAARDKKPVIALINADAHSAGYYLASQASKIISPESGSVGSIGVFGVHRNVKDMEEKAGVETTIIKVGANKAELHPSGPKLSDETKSFLLEGMQESYDRFVQTVARGRGVSVDQVESTFGQGRSFAAKKALELGMIDQLGSVDDAFSTSTTTRGISVPNAIPSTTAAKEDSSMDETLRAIATAFGIEVTADTTAEDVTQLIIAQASEVNGLRALQDDVNRIRTFQEQFPEEYARMQALESAKHESDARTFASKFEKFSIVGDDGTTKTLNKGFSALVLQSIEDGHKKLASATFSVEDLDQLLTGIASNGIVEYGETGSRRTGNDTTTVDNNKPNADQVGNARQEFAKLVASIQKDDELSYKDAVVEATKREPELALAYRRS